MNTDYRLTKVMFMFSSAFNVFKQILFIYFFLRIELGWKYDQEAIPWFRPG